MKFHPVSELFPLMTEGELDELAKDIKEHGVRVPIWKHPDGSTAHSLHHQQQRPPLRPRLAPATIMAMRKQPDPVVDLCSVKRPLTPVVGGDQSRWTPATPQGNCWAIELFGTSHGRPPAHPTTPILQA
jgi:hypothetical protein